MGIVLRVFEDAAFAFDPTSHRSLFVEGTTAELVPTFIENPNQEPPDSFWSFIPDEFINQASADVSLVRYRVKEFLGTKSELQGDDSEPSNVVADVARTATRELALYAARQWQLVNTSIELTNRCNLRCGWCYLDSYKERGMRNERLCQLADELKTAGNIFVMFTGGEVFTRKDIVDVVSVFNDLGFILEVKSNGLAVEEAQVERLSKMNLFNVQISVYGVGDATDTLTGAPYDFGRVEKTLNLLNKYDVPVSVAVLVGKHTIDKLDRFHEVLSGFNISDVSYSPYITPNRKGPGAEMMLRLSFREMEKKFLPFLEKIGGVVKLPKYRDRRAETPLCFAGRDQIAIGADGSVYPCIDYRLKLGNLHNESLPEILGKRKQLIDIPTMKTMQYKPVVATVSSEVRNCTSRMSKAGAGCKVSKSIRCRVG